MAQTTLSRRQFLALSLAAPATATAAATRSNRIPHTRFGGRGPGIDRAALVARHAESRRIATIALKKFEFKVPYGHVTVTPDFTISGFAEKPTLELMANAGVYAFESRLFNFIPSGKVCSLETEVFPALVAKGERPAAYYEDATWNDVGTLTDFEKVNDELLKQPLSLPRNAP